jgi:hypothetical protein
MVEKAFSLISSLFDDDSRNIRRELKRRSLIDTADFVEKEMFYVRNDFNNRFELLEFAVSQISIPNGLWLEFGVYQGETIQFIAHKTANLIYGFDSFQGNPEAWRGEYPKGAFSLQKQPTLNGNIELVSGWFKDTLPKFNSLHYSQVISFIHMDCDLYSSAKTVLDILAPLIVSGTIIVFDEFFNYPGWRNHEFKAFTEFISNTGISYEYLGYVYKHSQVAVKII